MKCFAIIVTAMAGFASAALAQPGQITVTHPVANSASAEPTRHFTGSVRVESRFHAVSPARTGGGIVTFEPGARTAWHTHPLGQTLIVTKGTGRVRQWNGSSRKIGPGDIVWIPPEVKHWHGASATETMSHIAIAEALDGQTVAWMEPVSEEQYRH